MCKCIEQAEGKAAEAMDAKVAKIKNAVITEPIQITTKAIMMDDRGVCLYAPAEGKYSIGKQKNIYRAYLNFSYCPFCGESLTLKKQL